MGETIVLREFGACDIELSASDYASLRSRYAGRLNITPTERHGVYTESPPRITLGVLGCPAVERSS